MNPRRAVIVILTAFLTSQILAEDFKTISGKEYKNATISRVESDGIVLKNKSGITKIYFTELSPDVQKRFQHGSAQPSAVTQENTAYAGDRLGGTAAQFAAWYGGPGDSPGLDKTFPLLNGAIHHTYSYQGWRIRAAFLPPDGPAVRIEYSKSMKAGIDPKIQDYELQAIMAANTPTDTTWEEIMYNNPDSPNKGMSKLLEGYFMGAVGEKMWQRSDGAILWLRSKLTVRLELPAAREYELKLKAEKEKRARESVPQF